MQLTIELTEREITQLIYDSLEAQLGDIPFDKSKLKIMVKSKQNYRSEWEVADFKATYTHHS